LRLFSGGGFLLDR